MLLLLNSIAHFLVDGVCAATVFGRLNDLEGSQSLIFLYNTAAFSTQCLAGLAMDRAARLRPWIAGASMLAVAIGFALPFPPILRVLAIGLGNSAFHAAGGSMTLEQSHGRAADLGAFVAPGAVGLAIGTLFPQTGVLFALLLTLCAFAVVPVSGRTPVDVGARTPSRDVPVAIPALLTAAVAVRAAGGSVVAFPWKRGAALTLALTLCVFAGKFVGGFLCDRIGVSKTALLSVPAACLLTVFCSAWAAPSLAGQFALNLTMPVTLWLLYRAMPDAPGFAFGLTASALWPGSLAGRLIRLTGPARRGYIGICFLFGLFAILFSNQILTKGRKRT
jgi:FSR family fosmidomycin resistance protein-like MFS transporter